MPVSVCHRSLFFFPLAFLWIRVIYSNSLISYSIIAVISCFVLFIFYYCFFKKKNGPFYHDAGTPLSTGTQAGKWNGNVSVSVSDTDKLPQFITCSSTHLRLYDINFNITEELLVYSIPQHWEQTAVGIWKNLKKKEVGMFGAKWMCEYLRGGFIKLLEGRWGKS